MLQLLFFTLGFLIDGVSKAFTYLFHLECVIFVLYVIVISIGFYTKRNLKKPLFSLSAFCMFLVRLYCASFLSNQTDFMNQESKIYIGVYLFCLLLGYFLNKDKNKRWSVNLF